MSEADTPLVQRADAFVIELLEEAKNGIEVASEGDPSRREPVSFQERTQLLSAVTRYLQVRNGLDELPGAQEETGVAKLTAQLRASKLNGRKAGRRGAAAAE